MRDLDVEKTLTGKYILLAKLQYRHWAFVASARRFSAITFPRQKYPAAYNGQVIVPNPEARMPGVRVSLHHRLKEQMPATKEQQRADGHR